MKNKLRLGFAQFPLILGLLIMAIAVPVATRLVEEGNMDTRNRATGSYSCQKMLYSEVNCRSAPRIVEGPYTSSEDKSECVSDFEAGSSYRIVCTSIGSVPSPTVPVATATVPATTAYDASKCANELNNDDWCVATDDERADCRVLQGVETTVASTVCSAGKCCRVTLPRGNPCSYPSSCVDGSELQPRGVCTFVDAATNSSMTGTVEPNGECTTSVCCRVGVSAAGSPTVPAGATVTGTVTATPVSGQHDYRKVVFNGSSPPYTCPGNSTVTANNREVCVDFGVGPCAMVDWSLCPQSPSSNLTDANIIIVDNSDGGKRWAPSNKLASCATGHVGNVGVVFTPAVLQENWLCGDMGGYANLSVRTDVDLKVVISPPTGKVCEKWRLNLAGQWVESSGQNLCEMTFRPAAGGVEQNNIMFYIKDAPVTTTEGQACSTVGQWDAVNCRKCTSNNTWGSICSDQGSAAVGSSFWQMCDCNERCNWNSSGYKLSDSCLQFKLPKPTVSNSCSASGGLTLNWGAVTGAVGYALRISKDGVAWDETCSGDNPIDGNFCKNFAVDDTSSRSFSFNPGSGSYTWWVHAIKANLGGRWNNFNSEDARMDSVNCTAPAATSTPVLTKPTCLNASGSFDVRNNSLKLRYDANRNSELGAKYIYECYYDEGFGLMSMGTATVTPIGETRVRILCTKTLENSVGYNGNFYVYPKIKAYVDTDGDDSWDLNEPSNVCDGTSSNCAGCNQIAATILGVPTPTATLTGTVTPQPTPTICVPSVIAPGVGQTVPAEAVSLRWNNTCGTTGYLVSVLDKTDGRTVCSGLVSGLAYSFNSYIPGHTYEWKVRKCTTWNCGEDTGTSRCADSLGGWTAGRTFVVRAVATGTPTATPTQSPACPLTGLVCASGSTHDKVNLTLSYNTYANNNGFDGIKVQRNDTVFGTFAKGTELPGTSKGVVDSGRTASTDYVYQALCYKNAASGWSIVGTAREVTCRTADAPVPTGCPNCSAVTVETVRRADGKYNVKLSWVAAANATGYKVWRNRMDGISGTPENAGFLVAVENVNGLSWTDESGYQTRQRLQYKVVPNKAGCDAPTGCLPEEVLITETGSVTDVPGCAPNLLHPNDKQALKKEAVTMDWSSCGNDKKYKVVVTKKGATSPVVQPVLGVGVTKYVFINYQGGVSYDWKVGTCNDSSCSNPTYSTSRSFSIAAADTVCANECPSSFKCYRKGTTGSDYRWFADGYIGDDYVVQTGVTTAAGCGNVAVPTFQGKRKGDANCDGKINLEDASSWRKEYVEGDTGTVTKNNWLADFNCDQKVGTADRSIWRDSYSSMQ